MYYFCYLLLLLIYVSEGQLRRLGASLDWERMFFTMDAQQSKAVTEAFIKLFDLGLLYRADHLVNWSCVLRSAISDIEVEHLQIEKPTCIPVPGYENPVEFGNIYSFAYKLADSGEIIKNKSLSDLRIVS